MTDWPVGLSTGCFYQTSIFDCLETIRNGGFCMVEICSFPAHLDYHNMRAVHGAARLLNELGMEAYSFHAPFAPDIDITSPDRQQREHSQNELLQAAEAAAVLGVRHLVIHPGPERSFDPDDTERMQRMRNAAQVLDRVSGRCRELGIGFTLENMLPHLLTGNTHDMLWIIGAMRMVNVATCLDTGHAHLSGDLYRVLYKLSGHLQLIHANDNRGTYDDHLPPGEGDIDWEYLLKELAGVGFRGGFVLELSGDSGRDTAELLAGARRARYLIRSLSKRLYLSSPPTVGAPDQELLR